MTYTEAKDFSESAVNLCNPEEVRALLVKLHNAQDDAEKAQKTLEETNPGLMRLIHKYEDIISQCEDDLRITIDKYGSYQDKEAGHYGVKQRKVSVTYLPRLVREWIPEFAEAVIDETANKAKILGLRKGGLITEGTLEAISEKAESFAYYIR